MNAFRRNEEGFALAAAVLALVVVGALVTGSFFAANQESRIGHSSKFATDAFLAAERGINEVLGQWNLAAYEAIPLDGDSLLTDTIASGGVRVEQRVRVRSLGNQLYFIESTGRVLSGGILSGAARRTGMVVRTTRLEFNPRAGLLSFGGVNIAGRATVNGADANPSDWDGCAPASTDSMAGIMAKDSSTIDLAGSARVTGDPPVDQDTTIADEDFFDFGPLDYDELAAKATKSVDITGANKYVYPASDTLSSGACNTGLGTNWGAPEDSTSACHLYFPVVHAKSTDGSGKLTLESNRSGQGILLVDGDLHLAGGFEWYGIVIVKGELTTSSGGAEVHGTTMVYTGGEITNTSGWEGSPTIQYSSCAVERAVLYNDAFSRGFPLGDRSWVDLSATGGVTY